MISVKDSKEQLSYVFLFFFLHSKGGSHLLGCDIFNSVYNGLFAITTSVSHMTLNICKVSIPLLIIYPSITWSLNIAKFI